MRGIGYGTLNLTVTDRSRWTVARSLQDRVEDSPDAPFLRVPHEGLRMSFREVADAASGVADALWAAGVRPHDRIVTLLPNGSVPVILWLACAQLGVVEVPLNTALRGAPLRHALSTVRPKGLFVHRDLMAHLDEDVLGDDGPQVVVVGAGAGRPVADRSIVLGWSTFLAGGTPGARAAVEVLPSDIASVVFTSGTTGPSKGVQMPHAQAHFFAEQTINLMRLTRSDVYMTTLPLFHTSAHFMAVLPALIVGCEVVVQERFSASRFVEELIECGATATNMVGVMMEWIWKQPPTPQDRAHRLRCIFSVPTVHSIVEAFKERFGVEAVVETYGQTEICCPVLSPYGVDRPVGAAGRLVDEWFEVLLCDPETEEEVAPGDVGELLLRPRQPWLINVGYEGMPDESLAVRRNLWYHTGDGLRVDEDGWWYFVDRFRDALRRRGENVSSFEVEEQLAQHEAVGRVAVIGVPSEGEVAEDEIKACVVVQPGQVLAPEALVSWAARHLPSFTVPRYVEVFAELPMTPSEKVQKAELRKEPFNPRTWDAARGRYLHPGEDGATPLD